MTAPDLCRTLRACRSHRLTRTTLHTLAYLDRQGGAAKLADIASELDISTAALTGVVDALEASGHIQRLRKPSDRRVIFAELLPKGRDALSECLNPSAAVPTLGLRLTR